MISINITGKQAHQEAAYYIDNKSAPECMLHKKLGAVMGTEQSQYTAGRAAPPTATKSINRSMIIRFLAPFYIKINTLL